MTGPSGQAAHPETASICCCPEFDGMHLWDYQVNGETDKQAEIRRRNAARLCGFCPNKVACLEKFNAYVRADDYTMSGVWGGRIFPPRPSRAQTSPGQQELMTSADCWSNAA